MVFALFTALHIAFTFRQLEGGASFNTYMTSGFEDATRTPGGVIFALPSFALFAMTQSVVASIILLSVLFIVAGSFITAHIVATRGSNSALAIVESQFEVDDKARKKKVSDDYKKTTKELDATLDAKYQEMLQKQSSKRMATAKSELGLTDPPKDFTPPPIQDVPVPLSQLQPTQMSAPEVITQMSTEAAQQFSAGMGQAFGQQPAASFDQVQTFGQQSNPQPTYSPPVTPPASYSSYAEHEVGQERLNRRLDEARKRRGMGSLDDRINSRGQQQMTMEVKPEKVYKQRQYVKPPISLITSLSTNLSDFQQDALEKQRILDTKLNEFGVNAKVTGFTVAPAVTRFEIQLDTGTKVQQVEQLQKDFSMVLGTAQTRLQLVEGKNAIGIEVPNKSVGLVSVKDIIASQEFVQSKSPLTVAIGKNLNDDVVIGDIATMPHLLIAGSTGTGKSVGLNTLLVSLLYRAHPDEVKLLLVDPKQVELNQYNDGPHMLIPSAITSVKQAINAMKWLEHEMRRRYAVLKANGVNNIGLYHSLQGYKGGTLERMPYIVMVIDEVADLIQQGKKEVEASIQSLSSLARACGIHMVLATQRPSTDIITGVIKTNFVVRMAFQVSNRHDSTTIISDIGAEKLVGKGDMLYMKESKIQRVQCAFTDIREASAVMDFIRRNNEADFDYELENVILNGVAESNGGGGGNAANGFGDNDFARGKAGQDPLFVQVLKWLVREENYTKTASISNIQRHFNVGFARAGRIIDQLAEAGYVTSGGGTKARNVLVTRHEVDEAYGE
jgi:DNA segregation ATPase FtsK/SpoIIIE-like protein